MSTDAKAFRAVRPSTDQLADAPINPDWIIEGDPRARGAKLSAPRGDGLSVGTWDCTAGRFRWEYATDEVIEVVEGMVRLTDVSGRTTELHPGDVATFDAGDTAYWEVPDYVRKVWVETAAGTPQGKLALKLRVHGKRLVAKHGVVKPSLAAAAGSAAGAVALIPF